jgi:hypothetical protein
MDSQPGLSPWTQHDMHPRSSCTDPLLRQILLHQPTTPLQIPRPGRTLRGFSIATPSITLASNLAPRCDVLPRPEISVGGDPEPDWEGVEA